MKWNLNWKFSWRQYSYDILNFLAIFIMDISISRHSYIVYSYKKSVYLHKIVTVCHTGFVIQNNKVNIEKEKKSLENHNPYTFLFNQQSTRDKTTKLWKRQFIFRCDSSYITSSTSFQLFWDWVNNWKCSLNS